MLFGRLAKVVFGQPGSEGISIEGIRIAFSVVKTLSSESNEAEIRLYNLSRDTLEQLKAGEQHLWLWAGYEEQSGLQLLFQGQIARVINLYQAPNRVTTISVFDGLSPIDKSNRLSLSFGARVKLSTVINAIAEHTGLVIDNNTDCILCFEQGYSIAGHAKDALDNITQAANLTWSVQNNQLQILSQDGTSNEAIRITANSGLIGTPERIQENGFELMNFSFDIRDGWRVQSLLQPMLLPGNKVSIDSIDVPDGIYRAESVFYEGDTHGQSWFTTTEVFQCNPS